MLKKYFSLLHNEERGDFAPGLAQQSLNIALAGAVLMDLALEDRIDTDLEHLILVDATPLDDDLLDPTLADIARDTDTRDTSYWVTQTAKRGEEIRDKALATVDQPGHPGIRARRDIHPFALSIALPPLSNH